MAKYVSGHSLLLGFELFHYGKKAVPNEMCDDPIGVNFSLKTIEGKI
jgi:hypothetical protein